MFGEGGHIYCTSINIHFLEGVPACMYLLDGKVLFISSGCSYYVYSIKHILNMHLIFISIRIWGLISFMTTDSFQVICILFCSLVFICSVLSNLNIPLLIALKWWIVYPPPKTNTSPVLTLWFYTVYLWGFVYLGFSAFCWVRSKWCFAQWRRFTAWQAIVPPVVFQ